MDGNDVILQDILTQEMSESLARDPNEPSTAPTPTDKAQDKENHSQWALGGNGRFMPVGSTVDRLPAGIYEPFTSPGSWGLELLSIASDGIYTLPDMVTEAVMTEVNTFWMNEQKYRDHNLLYKRGLILSGPPGGGKTVTVKLLMNELVKADGIVVLTSNVNLTVLCLKAIRRVEPRRNLIVVFEDIDEIINYNGEANVLSLLDGENNVDNILHLATTNYPERLGARIINRPSRFDRHVHVGMPGEDARRVYLEKATKNGLSPEDLAKWVAATKDMSIAHLRELVAAVYCLNQPYEEVMDRLVAMATAPKGDSGFESKPLGFHNQRGPR